MKYLVLLRHAKSSWKEPQLADFDRPLNKRGRTNAPLMGQRLAAHNHKPDVIIASPALRARWTAELVAVELHCEEEAILWDERLYGAGLETLLDLVRNLRDIWQSVLLVGHNPGLTELANYLAPSHIDNIVTCGMVRLEFPVHAWRDLAEKSGSLQLYDSPRKGRQ
ncbi:MAG: SixA phosphatase family protein [Desulfuromonadales bacterium]